MGKAKRKEQQIRQFLKDTMGMEPESAKPLLDVPRFAACINQIFEEKKVCSKMELLEMLRDAGAEGEDAKAALYRLECQIAHDYRHSQHFDVMTTQDLFFLKRLCSVGRNVMYTWFRSEAFTARMRSLIAQGVPV